MSKETDRRSFLGKALAGAAGVGAALSLEEQILLAAMKKEGSDEKKKMPSKDASAQSMQYGKIGDVKISRMIMGGNLIGGWSHARDLIYVSQLFKSYNTEEKVFETLELGEQHGINTIQVDPKYQDVVEKYNKARHRKMQTIICMSPTSNHASMRDQIRKLVDTGATMLYTHGGVTDKHVMLGDIQTLGKALDLIKKEGLKAGIGGHALETVQACEKHHLGAEYYVKTLHRDKYWSATPEEGREPFCWFKGMSPDHDKYHDNMFCLNPEETIEYMETIKKPWIAFKTLAAGAIQPRTGFSYAFRNGADFICVGMFDFQIAADVSVANGVLKKLKSRSRPWYA